MARIAHVLHAAAALAIATAAALPAASAAASAWTWPVRGEVLTEYRNGSDPYAGGQHRGIDIAAPVGEPVIAAVGGTVRFAGMAGSSGLIVSVRGSDGLLDASYLHLGSTDVRAGERVASGQRIGAVGTSGERSSSTPHLHFGVRRAGSRHSYRDPRELLPPLPSLRDRPRGAPVPVRSPVPIAPRRAPVPALRLGSAPRPRALPAASGVGRLAERPIAAPQPRHGVDPGWAIAAAALLAIAALSGRSRRPSGSGARARGRTVARLLPLLGRR